MSRRAEQLLFSSLLLLSAVPSLMFEFFPSQDGPAHTANAAVIGRSNAPIIAEYFHVALSQGTNLLADLGLAGLLVFLSPQLADKTMALLLLVGLPLAVRFCLRQLNPNSVWLSIFAIPLGAGLFVYYGFYNFLLGVILSLFTFGFWLNRMGSGRSRTIDWVVFALLSALVYISHPLPLLALLLLISAAVIDGLLSQSHRSGFPGRFLRRMAPVFLVAFIPLTLLVAFGSSRSTEILYFGSPFGRLARFLLAPVMALSNDEIPFAIMPSLAIGLLGIIALLHARGSRRKSLGFLIASSILAAMYFLVPNGIGEGTVIPPRVALYVLIFALFWLAGQWIPRWGNIAAIVLAAVAVAGLVVVRVPVHADLNTDIGEYLSGQTVVQPNSTVLPLWGVEPEAAAGGRVAPRHLSGYLMATGEMVDLHHFLALLSISPVRFRDEYHMDEFLPSSNRDALILGPDLVDIRDYLRRGPGQIDYIWLWDRANADPDVGDEPAVQRLFQLLEQDYELAFVSSRGLLEVYARNETG